MTKGVNPRRRRRIGVLAAFTALVALNTALIVGRAVLDRLHINLSASRIAGALVIIALAWSVISSHPSAMLAGIDEGEPQYVVPLGFPALVGPGARSLMVVYSTADHGAGDYLVGLGRVGLDVTARLMGVLLLAIVIGAVHAAPQTALPGLGH